nr:hypothetical protein [Paracoccus isoporae]
MATATMTRQGPDRQDMFVEAYMLSGGALADLCSDSSAPTHHGADCSLCYLASAAALPGHAPSLIATEIAFTARIVTPRVRRAAGRARDPATPARGPPLIG